MATPSIPTIADIERICALDDPVIRNLQITQCYHELALAMAGGLDWNANWCSFATWASKQAGQTIRKEDLSRALENRLRAEETAARAAEAQGGGVKLGAVDLAELIWKTWDPLSAFDRSSQAVAKGNLKVFAEIGREFARFYADCLHDTAYDPDKIERFCDGLRPDDPPDGQRLLRQAFRRYYQALFEPQAKARVELLLLANLEIGQHEQTRLQPEITAALDAPVVDPKQLVRRLNKELHSGGGWLNDVTWYVTGWLGGATPLDAAVDRFVVAARRQAQLIVTETLMTIALPPGKVLRLGEDLTAGFPPVLQQIEDPDLRALLSEIDPTPDSTRESPAPTTGGTCPTGCTSLLICSAAMKPRKNCSKPRLQKNRRRR